MMLSCCKTRRLRRMQSPKVVEPASSTEGMLGRLLVQAHHVDVPVSGAQVWNLVHAWVCCFAFHPQAKRSLGTSNTDISYQTGQTCSVNFRILCTLVGWENRDFSSHLPLLVLLHQYQTMLEEHSSAEKTLLLPVCRTLAHPLNSTSCPQGFFWFQSSRRNNLRPATVCGCPRPLHSSWFWLLL